MSPASERRPPVIHEGLPTQLPDIDPDETQEWVESLDALIGSLTDLGEGGTIWLLTPKVGRSGYVDPADIAEAAPIAGLAQTTTAAVSKDWSATRLVAPKSRQ